jgi:outer membrane protein
MKRSTFLLVLYPVLLCAAVFYFLVAHKTQKTAFFYNQKVFDRFQGKLELESRLNKQAEKSKKMLDSLAVLIQGGRTDLSSVYQENLDYATTTRQQLSETYTADIWKYINGQASNYGDENGYDYIFGASGNGSLMYADTMHDITNEIVRYLNLKYEDKEP